MVLGGQHIICGGVLTGLCRLPGRRVDIFRRSKEGGDDEILAIITRKRGLMVLVGRIDEPVGVLELV
jgi:hypothetical protein